MKKKYINITIVSILLLTALCNVSYAVIGQGVEGVVVNKKITIENEESSIKPVEVSVIMYHHIHKEKKGNSMIVTLEKFYKDMKYIKEQGYTTIGLNDLYAHLKGEKQIEGRPIIVTFDDGYTSNYTYAYPIAKELDQKYVISVIGWSMGRDTFIGNNKPITPHFTKEQMKEMSDSGYIEIQNHTYDLHNYEGYSLGYNNKVGHGVKPYSYERKTEYEERLATDLITLNNILKEQGIESLFVTYPFGEYIKETEEVIKEVGFKGSVTTEEGIRVYKHINDLYEIPRYNITEQTEIRNIIK